MKKIVLLAGLIAAVFGAKKFFGKKEDTADETYASNGYVPQAQ
jgi:hypothetical protein